MCEVIEFKPARRGLRRHQIGAMVIDMDKGRPEWRQARITRSIARVQAARRINKAAYLEWAKGFAAEAKRYEIS